MAQRKKIPLVKIGRHSKTKNPELLVNEVTTLYCSFCGKSQNEVERLVAGPSVYICNECTDLCVEIVTERTYDRGRASNGDDVYSISIKFHDPLTSSELSMFPMLLNSVESQFPGCSIRYNRLYRAAGSDIIQADVTSPQTYDVDRLTKNIRDLTVKLRIEQQKYLSEKENREKIERRLSSVVVDVFPLLMDKLKSAGEIVEVETKNMTVMLLDVSGFSAMGAAERERNIDLLRSLGRTILKSEDGHYINTWGDAIVAAFDDPSAGLRCGCKFVSQFELLGLNVRVGVAWGKLRIATNALKGTYDIDGDAINLCARLEPLAQLGTVLCHEDVVGLLDSDQEEFRLKERQVVLKKGAAGMKAGAPVMAYEVRPIKNT